MVAFNSFFKSVLLAISLSSTALAVPYPSSSKYSTHRRHIVGRGLQVESYYPTTSYETYDSGVEHTHTKRQDVTIEESTLDFIAGKINVDKSNIKFRSGANRQSGKVAYVSQSHNGIPFANAVANVAFNKNNKVSTFGHSFVDTGASIAESEPSISSQDAISAAESALEAQHNGRDVGLEYLVKKDGSVALTHVVQVQAPGKFYEAFVDAHSKEVLQITDFVSKATYRVLPITKETPDEEFEELEDPEDEEASPKGWVEGGETAGNNAVSYIGSESKTAKASSGEETFVYEYDDSAEPDETVNQNAARVNAFYLVNTIHDFSYRYGFDEDNYNFQDDGGDRVLISVQDSQGTDNAYFETPPDGQSGQMAMFLWDYTKPGRDGAIENDIVTHEMTHGITNRMTGGGTGRCLQTTESGGMGEGWSDAMAEWTELKSDKIEDYVMGQWVTDDKAGIRSHPYSTSKDTNPLTYGSIKDLNEVHDIGEVWANVLHQVSAALLEEYGFSEDAKTSPDGKEGNVVFLHLFLDALSLQPCNPTIPEARDAWIQADKDRYDGANKCLLWKAFASRGLGQDAKDYEDDDSVPSDC